MNQIKISNKYIDNLVWSPVSACSYEINDGVDVWKVHIPSNLIYIDDFLRVLSGSEIARASRYIRAGDKNRSIISRGALRLILGKYLKKTPQAINFVDGTNKKPCLADDSDLFFNVSHSGDWILVAVAGSEIGVDVELIKADFRYRDVLEDYFTEEEITVIKQTNTIEDFYTLWTRKEALSKATSAGLDAPLKYFPALDGVHIVDGDALSINKGWMISSFKLTNDYVASIAADPAVNDTRFWDLSHSLLS